MMERLRRPPEPGSYDKLKNLLGVSSLPELGSEESVMLFAKAMEIDSAEQEYDESEKSFATDLFKEVYASIFGLDDETTYFYMRQSYQTLLSRVQKNGYMVYLNRILQKLCE